MRAIRKLLVTKRQQDALANGRLAVVRFGDGYELVPAAIAENGMLFVGSGEGVLYAISN